MKKEDINSELISKIEIQVEDTLFYLPGEVIKGKIQINPKYKIKDKKFHLILKIIQYEFWDHNNIVIKELKNIYKTIIQIEKIEYELNELELSKKDSSDSFEKFSIIEMEEEDKIISIPFNFKINDNNILPTFQFQNKDYILGIRHLLIAECEEVNSSNYTGLFIGKSKNIELSNSKEIKESYIVGLGSLEVIANFPKLSYKSDEEISFNIKTNTNLHFKKVTEIKKTFYRKINWIGYLKNSELDRTIYSKEIDTYNSNQYGLREKLAIPIKPLGHAFIGTLAWGLGWFIAPPGTPFSFGHFVDGEYDWEIGVPEGHEPGLLKSVFFGILGIPYGFVQGFIDGAKRESGVVKECLNLNVETKDQEIDYKGKYSINEEQISLLIEELKKFVFFKDGKIVGFIKFGRDITPPVNGYYFNCEYNIKIEVEITGIILNRNKNLKTQIDLYDSDEYITKMKNLFKTN